MPNAIAKKPRRRGQRQKDPAPRRAWFEIFERKWTICLLLIALTVLVYWPVRTFDYVNYDDADYVTSNSHVLGGLAPANFIWALTSGHASNWHPLTWFSHQLDCQLFGAKPGPQHVVSMAFHALNAALLFLILQRMTGAHWRSALVAALFALHPMRVESVAWISERKDVLSGLFFLLTLGAYCEYVRFRDEDGSRVSRKALWYVLALVFFALGLMSKPMLVTVPFLIFLLDYWPLARWELNLAGFQKAVRLAFEKVPFLLLAAASSVVTFVVQRRGGAVSTSISFGDRVGNAVISYLRYIGKTVWPVNLSVLYPHPGHWPLWEVTAAAAVVVLISVAVLKQIRQRPYLTVGWFWFIGTLVPVIGLVQVGIQSMADRYTYIPSIGLFIAAVWAVSEALRSGDRGPAAALAGTVIAVFALVSVHQVQFWRDSHALFERAVDVTTNNYLAYNNLGYYLAGKGKLAEAKDNYRKSLAINPFYSDALNNLGFALAGEGQHAQAIPLYQAALKVSPNQPEIHNNLGNALSESRKLPEAIEQYLIVLKLQPNHPEANNNLGIALAMQGKLDEALGHFRAAIRDKPAYASAHSNLGNALAAQHKLPEAMVEYEETLRLNPADPQAHNNLGNVLMEEGELEQAIRQYTEALSLKPDNPEAHFNLAIAYLRTNRRKEAAPHLQEVLRLNPSNAEARRQLELLSK